MKLINPECQICGSKNINEVSVTQYYLLLSKAHGEYRQWLEAAMSRFRKTVANYVDSLTKENLHDRAITRDLDWGIDVPIAEAEVKNCMCGLMHQLVMSPTRKSGLKRLVEPITTSTIGGTTERLESSILSGKII